MNILHLCSYYIGNKLYQKLCSEISKKETYQTIYIPIKNEELVNRNVFMASNVEFHYDIVLKKYDRFLYKGKVKKQKRRVEINIPTMQSINVIHAHTLFSDGGTAYLLKKTHDINYIVSVRNTDLNVFYKYAVHHRSFAHEVLINASAVIFISPAYKQKTFEALPSGVVDLIKQKTYVIPNAIDEKWFTTEMPERKKEYPEKLVLLFTGSLDRNKNLVTVLKLVARLVKNGRDVYLNVAGDGLLKNELVDYTTKMELDKRVFYHGNVSAEHLISLADQSDIFILPSYNETFGISYIESMSRGVPVIYTRNEGIDGYFPEGSAGYSTNPNDIDEMQFNIDKILDNYEQISKYCMDTVKKFNWKDIASTYTELYYETNS